MRKHIAMLLVLLLACVPLMGLAEDGAAASVILTGKVQAKDTVTVYAPFGGTVNDFTLATGDRIEEGDALLSLDTIKVYAPCGGTVRGIFAQAGDTAAFVQSRYGALCFIEPDEAFSVQASASQGYDSPENRILHIGEAVYVRATNNNARTGEGRITGISGDTFMIELSSGNMDVRDTVNIFRDSGYYNESRIGRGIVTRTEPVPVQADGAILSVAVREGMRVERGDLLFELVSGTLDGMSATSATMRAPEGGIVASISAMPGQMVSKNQAVLTLYSTETLQLVSSISELDVPLISVDGRVRIEFDGVSGKSYEGTITSISGIGTVSENYTEYAVYISFTPDESIRLGMSGTAYPLQ